MPIGPKQSRAQERAIVLVASPFVERGGVMRLLTKEEIASAVGVSRRTLYNWLAEPEFAAEVRKRIDAENLPYLGPALRKLAKKALEEEESANFLRLYLESMGRVGAKAGSVVEVKGGKGEAVGTELTIRFKRDDE